MNDTRPPHRRSWRETGRTSLLVAYVGLCLVFALPGGARFASRAVWNSPHNQQQFVVWSATLEHLGFHTTGPELQKELWDLTKHYLRFREHLLKPLYWLPGQLGFGQSWRMFSNPQTTPSRLWIEIDEGRGFVPVYVSRSTEHTWRRDFFEHHRVRKLLGRIGRGGKDAAYTALAQWAARRAFIDYPQAQDVRTRIYTWTTPPPSAEPRFQTEPEFGRSRGEFHHAQVFSRKEVSH